MKVYDHDFPDTNFEKKKMSEGDRKVDRLALWDSLDLSPRAPTSVPPPLNTEMVGR